MRHDGLLLGDEMRSDINVIIRRKTDPHQGVTKQHWTDESGGVTNMGRQRAMIGVIILRRMGDHKIGLCIANEIRNASSGVRRIGKLSIGKIKQGWRAKGGKPVFGFFSTLLCQFGALVYTASCAISGNAKD